MKKKTFLTVAFSVLVFALKSQIPPGPHYEWTQNFDPTANSDIGIDVDRLTDGNFVIGATKEVVAFTNDIEIRKIDPKGNTVWTVNFGGSSTEAIGEIKATADGGFVLVGRTGSYGSGGGNEDIMLLKYNTSGVLQWQKFYGVSTATEVGYTVEPINGGAGGYRIGGTGVITTDASGNQLTWLTSITGGTVTSITNTSDGGFAVVTQGPVAKLNKYNSSNVQLWSITISAQYANNTYPEEIQETPNGDLAICGEDYDASFNVWGAFFIRTNSTGGILVNRTYYTGGWNALCDVHAAGVYDFVQDGAGNFILAGDSWTGNPTLTGTTTLLIKVNANGNLSEPFYTGITYPGTWLKQGNIAVNYNANFYGIVAANECGDGFVSVGFEKPTSSTNNRVIYSKFYDTDYNWVPSLGNYDYYTATYMDITANTTWTGPTTVRKIAGKLVVKAPFTLTISNNATLEMGLCGKIIVEPGAKLIVDNAKITSLSGYAISMWKGIDVWGTKTASQSTVGAQGQVIIRNNAVIENAMDAITTIKDVNDIGGNGWDWNFTGGIIKVTDSKFQNNKRDVQYLSYQNHHPTNTSILLNNQGYFRNTSFETNAQLRKPTVTPTTHVTMFDVTGLYYSGCVFKNTAPPLANSGIKGNGINSIDARYTVNSYCSSFFYPCPAINVVRSKFDNLNYGITASNGTTNLRNVTVDKTDFVNVNFGTYLKNSHFSSVTNSTYDVGSAFISYGLYFDQTQSFKCEANTFGTSYSGWVGVIVNDMLFNASSVYSNTFKDLYVGTIATYDNFDNAASVGLKINCDQYYYPGQENIYDVAVTGGTALTDIDPFQGTCTSNPQQMVRNTYGAICVGANENQYYVDKLSTNPIIHANTTGIGIPACFDPIVLPWPCSTIPAYQCPSTLGCDIPCLKIAIASNTQSYNTAKVALDEGADPSLITAINSGIEWDDIKDLLISKSPYLSDEVLIAYIQKEGVPNGHLKQVILANSPLTQLVMDALNGISLPNGINNQISSAQTGFSARTELEGTVNYYKSERYLHVSDLIREFLADSTGGGLDSVIEILKIETWTDARCKLVDAYIEKGDFSNALLELDELHTDPTLESFCEFKRLVIELNQELAGCFILREDDERRAAIEVIADDVSKHECKNAQAILTKVFDLNYPEIVILPTEVTDPKKAEASHNSITEIENGSIRLYPNPANNYIMLDYVFNDENTTAQVTISDLLGNKISAQELTGNSGTKQISTILLSNGVYVYTVVSNGKVIANNKFIIIR